MYRTVVMALVVFLTAHCGERSNLTPTNTDHTEGSEPLFTLLTAADTKLNFINVINESPTVNGVLYEYLYNGGGIAVGDLNGDRLPDIYFVSNLYSNKLFINIGNLEFRETTAVSKVKGEEGFPTGVSMVDINSDGLLDIYVCKSGDYSDLDSRRNELYLNQGNNDEGTPVFSQEASKYGLDLPHYSTQAAFFDFDKDNDLDMLLINHGLEPADVETNIKELQHTESPYSSDRLYRNDDGKFTDVSLESGMVNNSIGFGLGVAIGDLNNDQWPDILVGHDYSEKDHLYLNQKNGTFKEVINTATNHIANFSMGNDIADINNDGWLDFISVDMVSNNNYDLKTSMSGMNPDRFQDLIAMGLHHQYMFNVLQLNNGNMLEEFIPAFSDIAQFSGVSNTNWSWAPLLFDMNNDGWQDLFVTNGVVRSFRNNDFVLYKRKRIAQLYQDLKNNQSKDSLIEQYYKDLLVLMPSKKEVNLLYLNNGDYTFSDMNNQWDLQAPTCSNGAAYADLDNDGDLDIVTNNINDAASIYRNNSRELGSASNYLKVELKGPPGNINGIGARVVIETNDIEQTKELYMTRGFQSSVSSILHYGIGGTNNINQLTVQWPDGNRQVIPDIEANQQITLDYRDATDNAPSIKEKVSIFRDVTRQLGDVYRHTENEFDDFQREGLLPHKLSQNGPAIATGDVNNDGLDDFYIGGAKDQSSALYFQQTDGTFLSTSPLEWTKDKRHEDIASAFFDADSDGDIDLYVVSGSNEMEEGDYYQDRLYENLGDGNFSKLPSSIPDIRASGSCVQPADFDNDGDLDLFVGGKLIPGRYPHPANSYLLRNDSRGEQIKFVDVTQELAPFMSELGMVSDAEWIDVDNDNHLDLIVVGEWMPIMVIKNTGTEFIDISNETELGNQKGWWFSIASSDFDKDGDEDFIVGNLGLNYKYKATIEAPFEVYSKDFDSNGNLDIVLGYHEKGTLYPLRGRECTSNQMPFIKEKFPSYHEFGLADMSTVYGVDELETSLHYSVTTFATTYVENLGNAKFKAHALDGIAQFSSVNSILVDDFTKDGNPDALLTGNLYQSEVETPRNDAGYGVLLEGNGRGQFKTRFPNQSGLFVKGEVKNASVMNTAFDERKRIVFGKNDHDVQIIEY